MEHSIRWAMMALLWSFGACTPAPVQFALEHRDALADSAVVFIEQYAAAVSAADWDAVSEAYLDDDRLMLLETGRIAYRSRGQLTNAFEELSGFAASASLELSEIHPIPLAPGIVQVLGLFDQSFTAVDGSVVSFGGALSLTLIGTDLGFRIISGHTSSADAAGG